MIFLWHPINPLNDNRLDAEGDDGGDFGCAPWRASTPGSLSAPGLSTLPATETAKPSSPSSPHIYNQLNINHL